MFSSGRNAPNKVVWSYSILTAAGFRRRRILDCFEQLFEEDNNATMGSDSSKRLGQIRTVLSIYETFIDEAKGFSNGSVNRAYEEVSSRQTTFLFILGGAF